MVVFLRRAGARQPSLHTSAALEPAAHAAHRPHPCGPPQSLGRFAAAWLLAVLLFFTLSATKLPSYWLVATPAAALLVAHALPSCASNGHSAGSEQAEEKGRRLALAASAWLLLVLSAGLVVAPLWLAQIQDPSLPGLQTALGRSPALDLAAGITLSGGLLLGGLLSQHPAHRLLHSQAALLLLVPLALLPIWQIGDQLRGSPIRALAASALKQRYSREGLAMVGQMKPSLHFYSRSTVIFEGSSPTALINLADRLRSEVRPGLRPARAQEVPTLLMVIDTRTASQPHWQGWKGQELAHAGTYRLWRLDRLWLEERARQLGRDGRRPSWRDPRPERF